MPEKSNLQKKGLWRIIRGYSPSWQRRHAGKGQEQEATVGTVALARSRKMNTNVKFTIQRRTPDSSVVP